MEFKEFKDRFQKNFSSLVSDVDHLFTVEVDPDVLWNLYLDSFPQGTNEVFRVRREYDCSCCRSFIKRFGPVVRIKGGVVTTIWNFQVPDTKFQTVINALDKYIKSCPISGVFITKDALQGTTHSLEQLENGTVVTWTHFSLELPSKFVYSGRETLDTVRGEYRAIRDVFSRSLNELTLDSVDTVLELINSNTLYKGEEWKRALLEFRKYKVSYESCKDRDLYTWENSLLAGPVVGKIRNHSIGVLLSEIVAGVDLDKAVTKYEKVVAPTNYKRPKAIFTAKMLEEAKQTIEELGYMPSLSRRHATLDDINVNNILFANRDASKRISGGIFDELQSTIAIDPKKFSRVEEIPVDKFISDVLPTAKEIEVFFENKHAPNMVSLIAPTKSDAPSMFKWNNAFSWAYAGNITDSIMRENVKMAGGNVEGVLRFSIQWNDGKSYDGNDLDAHCIEPNGNRISYRNKDNHASGGRLDVDIIHPCEGHPAVENITWSEKSRMPHGTYEFKVHQYSNRGGKEGFKAEIEFEGQIFEFSYPNELKQNEFVHVANVEFDGTTFTLTEKIPSQMSTVDVWGMKTNQFVPVTTIMFSPNYWDEQEGIGHRHVFFMLKGCVNDQRPNGYYNEFLKQELYEHKRVFEALSSKSAVETVDDQLSGLGFSTTKRASVIVKVKGNTERVMKVTF